MRWKDSFSFSFSFYLVDDCSDISAMSHSMLKQQNLSVGKRQGLVPTTAVKKNTRVLFVSHGGQIPLQRNLGIPTTRNQQQQQHVCCRAQGDEDKNVTYNNQFGYSRKDIILIGAGLTGMGFFLNWLLQSVFQMDAIMAGNYAQLIIFVGLCVGWIGSYLFRVATKQMTYAKQLEDYEEAVMQKRLDELPEAELENIMESIEEEKRRRGEL